MHSFMNLLAICNCVETEDEWFWQKATMSVGMVKYLEGLCQRILHKLKLDLAVMYHGCIL